MEEHISRLYESLSSPRNPTFLFVGQSYLTLDSKSDPLISAASKRFDLANNDRATGYSKLFEILEKKNSKEPVRAWLSERANSLVPPAWLQSLADFHWNSVWTTSIDGLLNRLFRCDWRQVQPVYSHVLQPIDPRNKSKLHINYIYGVLERSDDENGSPLDLFDLAAREQSSSAMLQRIPEALTPFGTLLIEAYNPSTDWLTAEKIFPVLMALEDGQAYLFSTDVDDIRNPFLLRAISRNKLFVIKDSLAAVLMRGIESGLIPSTQGPGFPSNCRALYREQHEVLIPQEISNAVSRFATILDSTIPAQPKSQSPEKRYSSFREFLAESGTDPIWAAYPDKLHFERDCEEQVLKKVKSQLSSHAFKTNPVILHGQTGVGKTIALASIAYKIHRENNHPVVFIARRSQRFSHSDLDGFCNWSEDNGFPSTLIVWDGMQDISNYEALHRYLLGRGRKFVLLASAYKADDEDLKFNNCFLAPALLTDNETPRFKSYLSSFEPTLGEQLNSFLREGDSSFLVAMYRLLPESRSQVRKGLNLEASAAASSMRAKSESVKPEFEAVTILQVALAKAGMLQAHSILPSTENFIAGEWVSAEQELIGLVMVPGKFGLSVPIEVILRAISKSAIVNFHQIIKGIDLFRLVEEVDGNMAISPRHALEAKLITQARLGGVSAEIEYASKLLLSVRKNVSASDTLEVQFANELVRSLGQNGPEKKLYSSHYLELADVLRTMREENGIVTTRLMLQEASLLRESIVSNLIPEDNHTLRMEVLERAEEVLRASIDQAGNSKRSARLKGMLLNELASTHGVRAREYIRADKDKDLILNEFNLAQTAAMKARGVMPEDYFPIDVIAWSTKDVLTHAKLNNQERLDIIVNFFNVLSLCDGGDISRRDKSLLERRRFEFGDLIDDDTLREESLEELKRIGSTTGIYLQALYLAKQLPKGDNPVSTVEIENFARATQYLEENYDLIKTDGKCLYLYLRYWWTVNSKLPFFPAERTALPFNKKLWARALEIISTLLTTGEEFCTPSLLYLQAICTWQLGYYDDADQLWRELERISDRVTGRRRVLKGYVASDASGAPLKFNGTVTKISTDGTKGELFVEGIRRRVIFFPKDFKIEDISRGEHVSGFHVAFNYIAPTADPAFHYTYAMEGKYD